MWDPSLSLKIHELAVSVEKSIYFENVNENGCRFNMGQIHNKGSSTEGTWPAVESVIFLSVFLLEDRKW